MREVSNNLFPPLFSLLSLFILAFDDVKSFTRPLYFQPQHEQSNFQKQKGVQVFPKRPLNRTPICTPANTEGQKESKTIAVMAEKAANLSS